MSRWQQTVMRWAGLTIAALCVPLAHGASLDAVTTVTNNGVAPPSIVTLMVPPVALPPIVFSELPAPPPLAAAFSPTSPRLRPE